MFSFAQRVRSARDCLTNCFAQLIEMAGFCFLGYNSAYLQKAGPDRLGAQRSSYTGYKAWRSLSGLRHDKRREIRLSSFLPSAQVEPACAFFWKQQLRVLQSSPSLALVTGGAA